MTYVDNQYICVARKNEMQHHEHILGKLQAQIAQLTKTVAWELEQHHSRIIELQQLEGALALDDSKSSSINEQPTVKPVPSAPRRKSKARKNVHRATQEHVAQLVA